MCLKLQIKWENFKSNLNVIYLLSLKTTFKYTISVHSRYAILNFFCGIFIFNSLSIFLNPYETTHFME